MLLHMFEYLRSELDDDPQICENTVLPDFCGYKSLVDLRRVFKARTGETIWEFMRRAICLILVLLGVSGLAAADFYRAEKKADGWTVVDASERAGLLHGVDTWAGIRPLPAVVNPVGREVSLNKWVRPFHICCHCICLTTGGR